MANVLKSRHFVEGINTIQTEVFNLEDVAVRAKQYLDTVREQAHALLAEAKAEAVQIREQASASGVAAGQQHVESQASSLASRMAKDQVVEAMKSLDSLSKQLEQATQQWLRQWQHETVPFAIAIAEKLVARQVDADPEILMRWIEETIRLSHGARNLRIRIHPADAERLQPSLNLWLEEQRKSHPIELIEDDKLSRPGLVLETSDGRIDMQLQSQLDRLREELN